VLSALTVLVAATIVIGSGGSLLRELEHLHPAAWAVAWIAIIAVGMAHELAHGLTCKYFGGEVHEIGFLLLYFQPALYCNVSDAWLFPEKSKRLWVMLAGSWFELFLWALASITWFVTQPHTPVHDLSLVIAATSGVKTLLNFNPLLKLDGYYMLCDVLEIPNLRGKAFRAVGARLKRWIAGRGVPEPLLPRESRAILVFGWTAVTFSIVFLGVLAARIGAPLFARYHLLGAVPFATMVGLALQRRLGAMFAAVPGAPVAANGAAASPHHRATSTPATPPVTGAKAGARCSGVAGRSGLHVERARCAAATAEPPVTVHPGPPPAAPARAPRQHRWIRPVVLLVLVAAGVGVMLLPRELQVGGQFVIAPLQKAEVRTQIDGIVANVLVHEGQRSRRAIPSCG
jgi:hypothetical protein